MFSLPPLRWPTNGKGMRLPKVQKEYVCQREQKDSPKAERNCMSFKQKREMILDAYLKLSKKTKEEAASTLNISRPLLYKLWKEKEVICSPDSRN